MTENARVREWGCAKGIERARGWGGKRESERVLMTENARVRE
jgi:hypothetical protein